MDDQCADPSSSTNAPDSSTSGCNTQVDEIKEQSSSSVKLLPPLSSLPTDESMDLERAYSCRICLIFCVMCIKKMNKKKSSIMCGVCRKHTFSSHKRLGKNFLLIDILEKNGLLGVEEEKKAKPKSKVERNYKHAENDNWSDLNDTDSTFEEDDSQYDGVAYPNDFNSFSIAVDEIEEFHDQLENIQDLLYGFERGMARNDDFDRQLEELRSEMGRVEQRMRSDRASFRNIAAKSRQLYQLVRQTGTAAAQSTNNNQQQPAATSTESTSSSSNLRTWLDFAEDGSEEHLSAPSEDDWATSEGDDDFPSSRIARENRIVVFLSANFIRVLTRSSDNTQINQVECYLCNVVIHYSYQNAMQHINGRRHREYIRANQASPSEIAPVESGTSSSSIQPAQINALTWELEDDDATERQRDRDIILHALQNGNAFELRNTAPSNTAATASLSWRSSADNPFDTAQATSRNAQVIHPLSGSTTTSSQSNANNLILNDFGDSSNRTTFINNRAPVGSSRGRDWFGRGAYSRQTRATRPPYTSAFSRSTFDNVRALAEEQAENDDWDDQPSTNWAPFVPQPVPARAATAPSTGQSSEQAVHGACAEAHGNRSSCGTVRRAPGFANSSANNSNHSQGSSSGRFGDQPTTNAEQQDHTYTSAIFTPNNNLSSSGNSGSNRPVKKEDTPETSRPLLQPFASNEWADLSDREESSTRRTRRRSRNSNASNTSSGTSNRRGRLHVSDVHRRHQNNRWGNGRGNNQSSSLNEAIARNLGHIGSGNDWSENDQPEESHPTPPSAADHRQETSEKTPKSNNHGTQDLRCGSSCNTGRGNCQFPRGSARTDGYGGRFGQNARRGNNQSGGNGQGSSSMQNRSGQRGGRGNGGGRFSSYEWD
uniref:Uncharacterized protein n=1 Tax=Ditylenchus dipsaci TaxID=166011 RepID=A0A915ENC9_9BILA